MAFDEFLRRKKNQLEKADKSLKQSWDKPILELCDRINKLDDYYTTSSCSGRILLIIDSKEKRDDLLLFVSHNTITLNKLNRAISEIKSKKLIYFKQDPCILHVACRNLENAQKIHDLAKLAGWKRCGIIASKDRFVVELNATERLEFPIIDNGDILVDNKFLKIAVSEANKKLKSSWEKIEKLKKMINKLNI